MDSSKENSPSQSPKGSHVNRYVPPWKEPYVIAMAGSSGSGKTSVAQRIIKELNVPWTILLSMDNFYKPLTKEQRKLAFESKYDFDSPDAIDMDMFAQVLGDLKAGRRTKIPTYSFSEHDRTDKWLTIYGANIIIVEGIYALYDERVLALTDLKVFIDSPIDICLARRLARDIVQRDRSIALSIQQWSTFVKPNFEKHLRYTMYNSDIRVPGGIKNKVVIDLLMSHVKRQLQKKSIQHLDNILSLENASNFSSDDESNNHKNHHPEQSVGSVDSGSFKNHIVLDQTNQLKALHTSIIGYLNTSRSDFIFSFNRVASLLLTKALDELDSDFYEPVSVTTPTGSVFAEGLKPTGTIASVIMVRGGGGCYHTALRKVLGEDGRASSNGFVNGGTGSILIQSDTRTGEPRLHSLKLPACIDMDDENHQVSVNETKVFLLDTQLSSGVAAIMGVSILLDHGIKQRNITVVAYMASDLAVKRVLTAYPDIKLVVASTEETIYPKFVENIYFGTTII